MKTLFRVQKPGFVKNPVSYTPMLVRGLVIGGDRFRQIFAEVAIALRLNP